VSLKDFKIISTLGRGAFGRVFLAELPANGKLYAIKVLRKDVLIELDHINSTYLEKNIMFNS